MSGLAGLLYRDERPVEHVAVATLHSMNTDRGGARANVHQAAGLALIACVLPFDALSDREEQPLGLPNGDVLTWDGRLDNREDLILRLFPTPRRDVTDAAVVGAALMRWGMDALPLFVGEWALAYWQHETQSVRLARDYMGVRPLHYLQAADGVYWSTSLHALVACHRLYGALDDRFMHGVLTTGQPPDRTPFRDVRPVPAAHVLTIRRTQEIAAARYWEFTANKIRYRDVREYQDHLRHVLADAVRVRLRTNRQVWSELSGGVDSTSVTCLADRLIASGDGVGTAVQTLTYVFGSSPESNERPYVEEVERWRGRRTNEIDVPETIDLDSYDPGMIPFAPYVGYEHAFDLIRRSGGRVLLTGMLGDLVMCQGRENRLALIEPLAEARVRDFVKGCVAFGMCSRTSLYALARDLTPMSLPPRAWLQWRTRAHQRLAQGLGGLQGATRFGLTPEFAARSAPESPDQAFDPMRLAAFPRSKWPFLSALWRWQRHDMPTSPQNVHGIYLSRPYLHRPLVEFVLAVPQLVLWQPTVGRALMRAALDGIVPPDILNRHNKGNPSAGLSRALRGAVTVLIDQPAQVELVRRGYLQQQELLQFLRAFLGGRQAAVTRVRNLLLLEAWLRRLDERARRPTVEPSFPILPSYAVARNASTEGGEVACTASLS